MSNRTATGEGDSACVAKCACGLSFPGPWELIGHFLDAYPPRADRPLDDIHHADATSLSVQLAEGPSEAWEVATWACDGRKFFRVAASIAMRSATGDLRPWAKITQRGIRDTYDVSAPIARNALGELRAAGIVGYFGSCDSVMARDLVEHGNATHRTARVLNLIADHVTRLEATLAACRCQGTAG
jgi:hypothetical protein